MNVDQAKAAYRIEAQEEASKYIKVFDDLYRVALEGTDEQVSKAAAATSLHMADTVMDVAVSGVPAELVIKVLQLADQLRESIPEFDASSDDFRKAVLGYIARVKSFHEETFRIIIPGPGRDAN